MCSAGKVLGGAWPTWSDWPSSQRGGWIFFRLFFGWHRLQRGPRFLRNENVLASTRANDTLSHRLNKEHARKSFSVSSISARCCDVCVMRTVWCVVSPVVCVVCCVVFVAHCALYVAYCALHILWWCALFADSSLCCVLVRAMFSRNGGAHLSLNESPIPPVI